MGIESTMTVKRSDAIAMLEQKRVEVFKNDCQERLAALLYEHRESIFENYNVVEDDFVGDEWERWKLYW